MIEIVPGPEEVAQLGASLVAAGLIAQATEGTSQVSLVLSGGRTPARLYRLLTGQAGADVPWARVAVFWGDERCVPRDDERSNYHLALTSGLLTRCFSGIHRILGELPPEEAADVYEAELKNLFPGDPFPRFDLVLLGLGEDGHLASLFPRSIEGHGEGRWVAATEEYVGLRRVTLTLPVLASARRLLFLVSGQEKARALGLTLAGWSPTGAPRPPAGTLLDMLAAKARAGSEGPEVTWLVDRAAASLLPPGWSVDSGSFAVARPLG